MRAPGALDAGGGVVNSCFMPLTDAASTDKLHDIVDLAASVIEADPERGVALAREAIELAAADGELESAIEAWRLIGFSRIAAADYSGAMELFLDAEEDLSARFGLAETPSEFLNGMGVAYQHLGMYVTAYSYLEEARKRRRPGAAPRSFISLENNLGLVLVELGDRERGIAVLRQALDTCESLSIVPSLRLALRANLAEVLIGAGLSAEAEEELRTILDSCRLPDMDSVKAQALGGLAAALRDQGRLDEALEAIGRCMSMYSSLGALRDLASNGLRHAEILYALGRHEEALSACDGLLALEAASSPGTRAEILAIRARALEDSGRYREACASWREYRDLDQRAAISDSRAEIMDRKLGAQRVAAGELQAQLRSKAEAMTKAQETIIEALAGIAEARDDVTGRHIRRAARYVALLLAEYLRHCPACITREQIELYTATAPLHDIGKVGIPDAILQKPGPLDADERAAVEEHPLLGERVLTKASWDSVDKAYADAAMEIVGAHHERWDGKGYPRGLAGKAIPLGGRIMAIADVYDAMRSKRPYKEALPHAEALAFIRSESGSRFDPVIVAAFCAIADDFERVYADLT